MKGRRPRAAAMAPDERRTAIVAATIPLLVDHGELVTVRQIAEAAGIAEGTIFRVFADKEELLAAAVETVLDPAPFERALAAIDATEPLASVVARAAALSQDRTVEIWRVMTSLGGRMLEAGRRTLPDSPALTRLFEAHRTELNTSPRSAAQTLRALTLALSHPLLVERPVPPHRIAHRFLHGVLADDARC